jgi:hypothetical protein
MYDPELTDHIEQASKRLEATLTERAPHLAPHALSWIQSIAPKGTLASYFMHERRFPMLLLPWWLAEKTGTRHEGAFHGDVIYSTIAGYLSIRLLDDALDTATIDKGLLPLGVVLNGEFQRALAPHVPPDSPFWELFTTHWYGAADFAPDHEAAHDFDLRVARRLGPSLIPLAAVAHHSRRLDLFDPWRDLLHALARLEQLLDDVTDWVPDFERGAPNILLAYHGARAEPGEPLAVWVLRDGLGHTLTLARTWLDHLTARASLLQSPGLHRFIESRRELIAELQRETGPGLGELARLRSAFDA